MPDNSKPLETLDALLTHACAAGADMADAVLLQSSELRTGCRRLIPEETTRAEEAGVSLRVWTGAKQAIVSSNDLSLPMLKELAERAIAMARAGTEDPDSTLAPESIMARDIPALDLFDAAEHEPEWLLSQCKIAEEAALSTSGITNTEGAEMSYSASTMALMTRTKASVQFSGSYPGSHWSLSVSALAGEGTGMERDYDYVTTRHRAALPAPETVGHRAAERTLKRLNPRKLATAQMPVVFDPRVGKSLLSSFASAISGASVARGTSFLKEKMGTQLFGPGIRVIDDPRRVRGISSRPFDAEGVENTALALVEDGVLHHWLLDVRSAGKLGLSTNGRAGRGLSSGPSPTTSNLWLEGGRLPPQELIADIKSGLYVTEVFGMGVNLVTGDYSQGASGYAIENGVIAYPVSEITIASHLLDMFLRMTPANDLEFRYSTNVPTLRIDGMTVAGA